VDFGNRSATDSNNSITHSCDGRIVRDNRNNRADVAIDKLEYLENELAGRVIQSPRRLVTQKNLRALGYGARDRDALLFAT